MNIYSTEYDIITLIFILAYTQNIEILLISLLVCFYVKSFLISFFAFSSFGFENLLLEFNNNPFSIHNIFEKLEYSANLKETNIAICCLMMVMKYHIRKGHLKKQGNIYKISINYKKEIDEFYKRRERII